MDKTPLTPVFFHLLLPRHLPAYLLPEVGGEVLFV